MSSFEPRRMVEIDADRILQELSARQHLNPHCRLEQVLSEVRATLGFCPLAAATALRWLGLDPLRLIGRLRRSELIQLARSIHRFWLQNVSEPSRSTPV